MSLALLPDGAQTIKAFPLLLSKAMSKARYVKSLVTFLTEPKLFETVKVGLPSQLLDEYPSRLPSSETVTMTHFCEVGDQAKTHCLTGEPAVASSCSPPSDVLEPYQERYLGELFVFIPVFER